MIFQNHKEAHLVNKDGTGEKEEWAEKGCSTENDDIEGGQNDIKFID